jgi:putative ABC transport system ATP-binding protein
MKLSYIKAENLVKLYGAGDAAVPAIKGMSFEINTGEFISIMGESGSGKSTLLSVMGALNTPTTGSYHVDDIDVYSLGHDKRADFRREFLGFVFQSFQLVPYLTVTENVMLPLVTIRMSGREKRGMAEDALGRVGLGGMGNRLPNQISGGEQERVAVARAIVNEPPILLADEPTGNLDTKTSAELMVLLQNLNVSGMTIIMVTHSPDCAKYAGRVIRMSYGLIVEDQKQPVFRLETAVI